MSNEINSNQDEMLKELLEVQKKSLSSQDKIYKQLVIIAFILAFGIVSLSIVVQGTS
jgi:hypothetical protein